MVHRHMAKTCIYCEQPGKLTREHVLADFLTRRSIKKGLYFTSAVNKYIEGAPTVRDVCATCNNGVLSKLDNYGSELYDKYFANPIVAPIRLQFREDDLCRWVLKSIFNGQRSFGGIFSPYLPYRGYILGTSAAPNRLTIFCGIMGPSIVEGRLQFPTDIRISDLRLPEQMLGIEFEIANLFIINSYIVGVLSLAAGSSADEYSRVAAYLKNAAGLSLVNAGSCNLDPTRSKITLSAHKRSQALHKPETYGDGGVIRVGDKTYFLTGYPTMHMALVGTLDGKIALATMCIEGTDMAVLGLERFPPSLRESDAPLGSALPPTRRAYAVVRRGRTKTYPTILDPEEIGRPYLGGPAGVFQSNTNWTLWKNAIERTGVIHITEGTSSESFQRARTLCVVSVIAIEE